MLANPARVIAVVTLIRQHMLRAHILRLSNAVREHKTAALYDFIVSDRYAQYFMRIDANAEELLELQVREKKFHDTTWKKEGILNQANPEDASRSFERNKLHYRHGT